jgi:hypothetical protein
MLTEVKFGEINALLFPDKDGNKKEGDSQEALKYAGMSSVGQVIGDTARFPWLSFDGQGSKEAGEKSAALSQNYMLQAKGFQDYIEEHPEEELRSHESFQNLMDMMHTASAYGFIHVQRFASRLVNGNGLGAVELGKFHQSVIVPVTKAFGSPDNFESMCKKAGVWDAQARSNDDYKAILAAEYTVGSAFGKMFGRWFDDISNKSRTEGPSHLRKGLKQLEELLKVLRTR